MDKDRFYLDKMLRKAEALLENAPIDSGAEELYRRCRPERASLLEATDKSISDLSERGLTGRTSWRKTDERRHDPNV